jgi:amidohydrolase
MPVINRIAAMHDEMTAWRHDIHTHPELGFREFRTSALVADKLREFGADEVVTGIGGTGVVAMIRGQGAAEAIGLRADIDALPIEEASGVPYASKTPGVMHACGHDGHTTMLLGAAKYLAETRNFSGTVYTVFQCAEESLGGALRMIDDGLFERFPMAEIYGMHNWPSMPAGQLQTRDGPIMAAAANITIEITGKGAHGAQPHRSRDPIVAAAAIVGALQSVVGRNVDPSDNGVVTIACVQAGATFNVIPETARMLGTARWLTPETGDLIERRVREIVTSTAAVYGCTAAITYHRAFSVTVNDAAANAKAVRAAETVLGPERVGPLPSPAMGSEDFGYMLERRPGSYVMLGGARTNDDPGLHHPRYDFNDEILPLGASYWATLVEQLLPRAA